MATKVCILEENPAILDKITENIGQIENIELVTAHISDKRILQTEQPQIVFLDVDYAQEKPLEVLNKIRQTLPEAAVFAMSKSVDSNLIKKMQYAGFVDCVHKPFNRAIFVQALDKLQNFTTKRENKGNKNIISFFSPKGKSGKTTLSVLLSMELAELTGKKIAVIDADITFADVNVFMDVTSKSTISEAIRDINFMSPHILESYFEEVNPLVKVLCGIRKPEDGALIAPEDMTRLIKMSAEIFDYVLVDNAPGFAPISIAAAEAADILYILGMDNGAYEIEHMVRAIDVLKSMDNWQERVRAIVTRVPNMTDEVKRRYEAQLECPVFLIPNEYLLMSLAANNASMIKNLDKSSALSVQIKLLAKSIIA